MSAFALAALSAQCFSDPDSPDASARRSYSDADGAHHDEWFTSLKTRGRLFADTNAACIWLRRRLGLELRNVTPKWED